MTIHPAGTTVGIDPGITATHQTPPAYRLLLRAYPRRFRDGPRGAELLGIVLDDAEARGRTRPSVGEAVDLVGHGLRTRLAALEFVLPAAVRLRVGQLSLVCGTTLAMVLLVFGELRWGTSSLDAKFVDFLAMPRPAGPFLTVGAPIYLGWLALFAAHLAGRPIATRRIAGVVCLGAACAPAFADRADLMRPPLAILLVLLVLAFGVVMLPRTIDRRERLVAAGVVGALTTWIAVWHLLALHRDHLSVASRLSTYWAQPQVWDWLPTSNERIGDGLWVALDTHTRVAVVVLVVLALIRWPRDRSWLPAVVLLGGAWLAVNGIGIQADTALYLGGWNRGMFVVGAGPYVFGVYPYWHAIAVFLATWTGALALSLALLHRGPAWPKALDATLPTAG